MEWFLPEPDVPVRQGDVLVSRDPQTGSLDEVCLVITADCDISKGKFGRQLACLRVLTVKDYVAHIWAKRKLDKLIKEEAKKLRATGKVSSCTALNCANFFSASSKKSGLSLGSVNPASPTSIASWS